MKVISSQKPLLNKYGKFSSSLLIEKIEEVINDALLKLADNLADNLLLAQAAYLYSERIYGKDNFRKINKTFDRIALEMDTILEDYFDKIKIQISKSLNQFKFEKV